MHRRLDKLHSAEPDIFILQGGARGADRFAKNWCKLNGVPCAQVDAQWDFYGNGRAGPVRNHWMLKLCPDICIHFPGGSGTRHMVNAAQRAGVACYAG